MGIRHPSKVALTLVETKYERERERERERDKKQGSSERQFYMKGGGAFHLLIFLIVV